MTAKEVTSVRVDPELVKKALDMGLVISSVLQEALEKLVKEKKCPTCGRKVRRNEMRTLRKRDPYHL